MKPTSQPPPHVRPTLQDEPKRPLAGPGAPGAPATKDGGSKTGALPALERLAAPLLQQQGSEADLTAQAKLLKAVINEEQLLARMPAGRPRAERSGALQNFLQRTLGALAERQVRVGNALQRYPSKLAQRLAPESPPRDALTRQDARGARADAPCEANGTFSAAQAPRGRTASRGSSSSTERSGRGRSVARPRTPLPPTPSPGVEGAHPGLLGKTEVFVELSFGKHPLPHEVNLAFMPQLRDARDRRDVTARASLLLLPDDRLVLMTSMTGQGGFGKARPGVLVATGEEVMVKESRRRMPRIEQEANRFGNKQTYAPQGAHQRHKFDRDVEQEQAMSVEFGGAAAARGMLRTSKSNYLVLGAMDDDLLLAFAATTKAERSALVRHLGPALLQQVAEMHAKGVLHLDLKAGNALVDYGTGRVALSDFGSARRMAAGDEVRRHGQPSTFPAPEVARHLEPSEAYAFTPASDVWSASVALLEMLQPEYPGGVPFSFDTFRGSAWAQWHAGALPDGVHLDEDFLAATASHRFTAFLTAAMEVDEALVAGLLAGPLHPNPGERPTAAQLARELAGPPEAQARSATQAGAVLARKSAAKAGTLRGQLQAGLVRLRGRLVEDYPHLLTGTEPFA